MLFWGRRYVGPGPVSAASVFVAPGLYDIEQPLRFRPQTTKKRAVTNASTTMGAKDRGRCLSSCRAKKADLTGARPRNFTPRTGNSIEIDLFSHVIAPETVVFGHPAGPLSNKFVHRVSRASVLYIFGQQSLPLNPQAAPLPCHDTP